MAIDNTIIRKGAKVRFLDAVGGGVVVGFADKNTVLVEDADGFEVPVLANKLVVVDDGSDKRMMQGAATSAPAPKTQPQAQGSTVTSLKKRLRDEEESEYNESSAIANGKDTPADDPADKPVTYRPITQERKGGDKLNIFLCFEPVHEKDLGAGSPDEVKPRNGVLGAGSPDEAKPRNGVLGAGSPDKGKPRNGVLGAGEWNMYVVNDSNYYVLMTLLSGENNSWILRQPAADTQSDASGHYTIEPNTTLLLETINRDSLNELLHICVQMLFYKSDRTFALKAPASIPLRLDLTRFYKWHLYQPNDFFLNPVLTIPLVEDNQASTANGTPKAVTVNLDELQSRSATDRLQDQTNVGGPARSNHAGKEGHAQPKSNKENEVIDLHIDALLDDTRGLAPKDILEYQIDTFRRTMDEYRNKKGKRLVFIHGKGEGVLRSKILSILKHDYPTCVFQDASFREYGFGATLVIIH